MSQISGTATVNAYCDNWKTFVNPTYLQLATDLKKVSISMAAADPLPVAGDIIAIS